MKIIIQIAKRRPGEEPAPRGLPPRRPPAFAAIVVTGVLMLQTNPEKICFIVAKARAFDVPEDPLDENPGSNATDDGFSEVLAAHGDDPTRAEIESFINALNEDEQAELVALVWLGRGDFTMAEWDRAVADARARREVPTADYLLGTPLLPDLLEEGLAQHGLSCLEFEMRNL